MQATQGYVPETNGITDISENAKGYSWYDTQLSKHWELGRQT